MRVIKGDKQSKTHFYTYKYMVGRRSHDTRENKGQNRLFPLETERNHLEPWTSIQFHADCPFFSTVSCLDV